MDIRELRRRLSLRARQVGPALAVALIAGSAGLYLAGRSDAASFVVYQEAETGVQSGAAAPGEATGASGAASVRFGTATPPAQPGSGCPPYPAFPDEQCTGWRHTGVTLQVVPGQVSSGSGWEWVGAPFNYVKITGNGAVLDGLDVNGCIYVDDGVLSATIKRSRITGNCDYMLRYANPDASLAINLTDVEIVGGAVQQKGAGFKWLRVNAHSFTGKAAMTGSDSAVEDSYIHGIVCNPPDHQSGVGTNGGASDVVIRHNHIDLQPTECTSGGIANYDDFGAFHDILIENNLINSGGYCLKAGFEDGNAAGNSGMQVIGNVFGRKYFADCGSFGVVSNWMSTAPGNVWNGNTWGSGSAANGAHADGDPVNP